MNGPLKARAYARDVLTGKIPAGKYVKLACERFERDLKRAARPNPDFPYKFDEEAADRIVRFMGNLPHVKGRWAARHEKLQLEPWQCFIECNLFGWIHRETGLRRFRQAYEEEPRKNGKALSVSTPVPTPDGWKAHGDLRPGDSVFGPDGQVKHVLAVSEAYLGPCRTMEFSDCPPIVAHDAHEWVTERTWYTKRAKGSRKPLPVVESQEIAATLKGGARGDFVHRVQVSASLRLPEVTLPIPPYTLGAWLGDGTRRTQNITVADVEVVEAIAADGVPVRRLHSSGSTPYYSMWNGDRRLNGSTSIKASLRRLGVLNSKHIPRVYLRASVEQRLELLRGLLDTDGYITPRGQIEFSTTSDALHRGVLELVRSLGMKPTAQKGRAILKGVHCGPKWRIGFFAADDTPLFKIKRKADRQCLLGAGKRRCRARTIVGAESCGEHVVNCIEVEGGLYLAGEGFVPTHNSCRLTGRGLYLFAADDERGAEVYSGATTEKQAMEVFRPAWQMLNELPSFRDGRGIKLSGSPANPGPIYMTADMSRFQTMIGKPGDGSSPHGAIIDEYHEHDDDHMVDAMLTGMGAREQPLLSIITTAGTNLGGPCYDRRRDVIRILEQQEEDDTQFGIIYGIDEEDAWDDPASLRKANPNYNVSVYADFLNAMLAQARRSAVKQNAFRTKHLNEWVGARIAWMNMLAWQRQQRKGLKIEEFKGSRCWFGADLATKKDVTALVCLFERNGEYFVIPRFYVPENAIHENDKYREFVSSGDMIATPGTMTDYEFIEEDIVKVARQVSLQDGAFDPAQAAYLITRLQKARVPIVEFPQTVRNLSEPMKEVEALTLAGKLWHDGNRAMTWMMGNVAAKIDAKEHIFPRKESPNDPYCKIDGAVALIMAMGRAILEKPVPEYKLHFV